MSTSTYRSSRPDGWVQPRPYSDPTLRRTRYGKIQPLSPPGFLERLLGRT